MVRVRVMVMVTVRVRVMVMVMVNLKNRKEQNKLKFLANKLVLVDRYTFYEIILYHQTYRFDVYTNTGRQIKGQTLCEIVRYHHKDRDKTYDRTKTIKYYTGGASCSVDDRDNEVTGRGLAFERALKNIGNKEHKDKLLINYIRDTDFNGINGYLADVLGNLNEEKLTNEDTDLLNDATNDFIDYEISIGADDEGLYFDVAPI